MRPSFDPLNQVPNPIGRHRRDPVRAAKRLLNHAVACEAGTGLLAETAEQIRLIGKLNQIEAMKANMENRAPRFADPVA